ncbi:katanin p80 WD40 repeat-containing subunit B1-like [Cebus imitator]|uniref:katanin p80 WD40 repeat-containing subunit B1-like n=1 Tax=Cebus imitator TaxID=2715852 RepID=UPI00189A52E7|nr:katanin p80 WD40 repeat-containing subunit B1-like [Cebus imitator]
MSASAFFMQMCRAEHQENPEVLVNFTEISKKWAERRKTIILPQGQIHHPGISIGDVAKKLSAMGNNLSDSARQADITKAENRRIIRRVLLTLSLKEVLTAPQCVLTATLKIPWMGSPKKTRGHSKGGSKAQPCHGCAVPGAHPTQAVKRPQQAELVDDDAMSQIRKGHDTMCVVLTSRHKNLDTVRAVWTTSDIKTSVDSAVAINDLSVVVDLLNIVNQKASLWKLDLCTTVLPQIEKLLQSKYESYVQTGCTSLKLILQRFLPLITDRLAAPPSVGVDISREERLHKCRLCHKQLKSISGLVKSKSGLSGHHGSTFRELHLLMASLD